MREKILLIDGHSILNRAFYGVPDLTNAEGLHTNAVYGFLNILFKILEEEQPTYLTVTFDVSAPTFRHEMYTEYKGTRKGMPDELRQQVPVLKELLQAMGITMIEQAGLEADDLLGTISKRCEADGLEVVIVSGDRDTLQLASEHTMIRIPKTKQGKTEMENYHASDVVAAYGVTPTQFIDVKALMGDASDNIPGVPGIGEKTATKIIVEYGNIEEAYAHVEALKPPRASKNLQEFWDQACMCKRLATIERDAQIAYDYTQARYENPYTPEAYVYMQRLQFKNLLGRFDAEIEQEQVRHLPEGQEVVTKEAIQRVLEEAAKESFVGLSIAHTEASKQDYLLEPADCKGVALCYGENEVKLILPSTEYTMDEVFQGILQLASKVEALSVFDLKLQLPYFPKDLDVSKPSWFDVTIAEYLFQPLKNSYSYLDTAQEQLQMTLDAKADWKQAICQEAYVACAVTPQYVERLKAEEMYALFLEIEMPLVFTLFDMEQAGIRVEREALEQYGAQLAGRISALEQEIYEEAGETFNINSPKQLGVVLFEHMQLPYGKKTKTGYSTAADVLDKLALEYPFVAKILEYRQLAKLKSTYADGLVPYICEDGRIHGKFHQTVTATGRISSAEPNLQNIPIRMELGRQIRKVFVPREGYVFVDADYSQIELRILAHCSKDAQLIQAYQEARDIHRMTASQVFQTPFEEVTDLQRRNAKAVNFGIVYGISSFGLSQDLSITRKEADQYIKQYFQSYPGIKTFLDDAIAHAKENGYVVTLYGRRRPIPELKSSNFMQRSFGERVAMNAPIQGTAADIMKIAMIGVAKQLKERGLRSRLILQVHDELLIEAHQEELEQVQEILVRQMEDAANLFVPLVVDMHTGNTWYDAK